MRLSNPAWILALVPAACDVSGPARENTPPISESGFKTDASSGPVVLTRSPLSSPCPRCGRDAAEGHVCKRSTYCETCQRETFPGHIHFRTLPCPSCGKERGQLNHVCHETRICPNPDCLGKEEIREVSTTNHVCGVTRYCVECRRDMGPGHIHGLTYYCVRCRQEVGDSGHVCDLSEFCPECRVERSIELHVHGLSRFCAECRLEVGVRGHVHGKGKFCPDPACASEVPLSHTHPSDPRAH